MSLTRSGKRGNILSLVLVLSFSVWILNSLSKDWFGTHGGSLGWKFLAVFIAAILLYPLPIMRMKRKAVASATLGDYDEALRISRKWLRTETYGRKFQGWIMLVAGRYSEALELLKDSAFDEKGHPLLKSQYLYYYAIALMKAGEVFRGTVFVGGSRSCVSEKRGLFTFEPRRVSSFSEQGSKPGFGPCRAGKGQSKQKAPFKPGSPSLGTVQCDQRLGMGNLRAPGRGGDKTSGSICRIRLLQ